MCWDGALKDLWQHILVLTEFFFLSLHYKVQTLSNITSIGILYLPSGHVYDIVGRFSQILLGVEETRQGLESGCKESGVILP